MPDWQTRIVGDGEADPSTLMANPANWRTHPEGQRGAMAAVLDHVGYVQRVVVNKRSGHIVDGHMRVEMAVERKQASIPVVYVDLSEDEERSVLMTLDPIAAMAATDAERLRDLLEGRRLEDDRLKALLDDLRKRSALREGRTSPDAVPPIPDEATTKPGDLWILGDHRVLCGDATSADDVARMLGGAKPNLMVTDPPYGVDYRPEWRNEKLADGANRRTGLVSNDDVADWGPAWALFPGEVVYAWHADLRAIDHAASLQAAGFELRAQIIWAKTRHVFGQGHYHFQHEPCWYAVRKGGTAAWIGDRSQTTLWQVNLDRNVDGGHSTQKPVECMARPIRNHEGDVYDPFLGSGTTVIAAEQLGRRCYGLEIEPRYVDVIVKRWEDFTGKTAVLDAC